MAGMTLARGVGWLLVAFLVGTLIGRALQPEPVPSLEPFHVMGPR